MTLFDKELDLVLYDMTSSYFHTELTDELRKYGFSRDKRDDCPQVTIGMVCTRDGIPVCHHVFPGNTPDKTTVKEVIRDLKRRFPLTRAVSVGDRGMLTRENIDVIRAQGLDYIVATNVRRDNDAQDLIADFQDEVDEARERWRSEIKRYEATGELPDGCESEDEMRSSRRVGVELEVGEDVADGGGVGDEGDDLHLGAALATHEGVDLEDAGHEHGVHSAPGAAGPVVEAHLARGVVVAGG